MFMRYNGDNTFVVRKEPKEGTSTNSNNFTPHHLYLRNDSLDHSYLSLDQC